MNYADPSDQFAAMVAAMEHQRLAPPSPGRDLDDDQMLEAVCALMRQSPKYRSAMEELIDDMLVTKGENVAIDMGLEIRDALEE